MTSPAPRRPNIVGIVNITADSFSDGGRHLDPARAIEHALQLARDGADVVELGAASSHPDAASVSAAEEIRRLDPVLDVLCARGLRVGVDSFQPDVQRHAAARGVTVLNDIQGFPDPGAYAVLRDAGCTLVVMHSVQRRGAATRQPCDAAQVLAGIDDFFAARVAALVASGIPEQRLVLDPGMGFFLGSNPEPSIAVLRAIPRLRARFGLPLLVSVSRKSFLGSITGRDVAARGAATLAAELFAAAQGVDWIRTHDVAALCDGLAIRAALGDDAPGGPIGPLSGG